MSSSEIEDWGGLSGTVLHWVLREGEVVYEDAT